MWRRLFYVPERVAGAVTDKGAVQQTAWHCAAKLECPANNGLSVTVDEREVLERYTRLMPTGCQATGACAKSPVTIWLRCNIAKAGTAS
jgi:hypothetical protein